MRTCLEPAVRSGLAPKALYAHFSIRGLQPTCQIDIQSHKRPEVSNSQGTFPPPQIQAKTQKLPHPPPANLQMPSPSILKHAYLAGHIQAGLSILTPGLLSRPGGHVRTPAPWSLRPVTTLQKHSTLGSSLPLPLLLRCLGSHLRAVSLVL